MLPSGELHSQAKFPYGVVTANVPEETDFLLNGNFTQIKDLGVNFIVHRINTANLPLIQQAGLKVIANNWNKVEDFIFDFSTAIRTVYKPRPEWFNSYTEEIRFNKGHEITIDGNSVWLIDTIEEPGDAVSQGPNVAQYDRYINRFRKNDTIPYILNWRMKIDPEPNLPDEPVCKLSVLYITEDTTILIADTILSASSFSDEFENHSLPYTLEELIGLVYLVQSNTDGPEYHSAPEDIEALTFKDGINYQLDFYGSRNLYIESIECYDETIWKKYMISSPELFSEDLDAQTFGLKDNPNILNWFVYDEPHSIDLYSPLKILYERLPQNNISSPINALYPGWNGIRNGNPTIKQFIDSVAPTNLVQKAMLLK